MPSDIYEAEQMLAFSENKNIEPIYILCAVNFKMVDVVSFGKDCYHEDIMQLGGYNAKSIRQALELRTKVILFNGLTYVITTPHHEFKAHYEAWYNGEAEDAEDELDD